jgi:hypothetical protein
MVSHMQTIETYELVSTSFLITTSFDLITTSFEVCATFAADADGSPVCSSCGWLAAEHEQPGAEVHPLPRRTMPSATPKRLAS